MTFHSSTNKRDALDFAELRDGDAVLSIAVNAGNTACEYRPGGRSDANIFAFDLNDLAGYASVRDLRGLPFLHPWANRLEGANYTFENRLVTIPGDVPGLRRDANGLPIHGLLVKSDRWRTVDHGADAAGARHTARLDFTEALPEFPAFPFAHRIDMTHRLTRDRRGEGVLGVDTKLTNTGDRAMPVSFGYHPYFDLASFGGREHGALRLPAKSYLPLSDRNLPNAAPRPVRELFGKDRDVPLRKHSLDHVFCNLVRQGESARFLVIGASRTLEVRFGPGYDVAVIYAPPAKDGTEFVCIEPMIAPTNALNLTARGEWAPLPVLKPGATRTWTWEMQVRGEG